MLQNHLVVGIAQGDGPQVVLVHELVEEVGAENDGLRDAHFCILELVQFGMVLDDLVEERQATSLATERALADTGEVGVAVELQTVELSHDTDVLHATVLDNGIEDNLTVGIDILQLMPCDMLEEGRHGEDGTGREPAAHVVTADVISQ